MKHYAGIDVSLNSCSVCAVVEAPSLRNCSLVQKECLAPEVVRTRGKLSAADGDVQNRYVEFPIKSQLQRDLQLRCRSDDFTFHRLKGLFDQECDQGFALDHEYSAARHVKSAINAVFAWGDIDHLGRCRHIDGATQAGRKKLPLHDGIEFVRERALDQRRTKPASGRRLSNGRPSDSSH
jgi:hypothetical protein